MSTIRKRGNKFQVQIRRHGFPDIAKTFTQLRDAKEWARHIEIAQDRNELANNHRELGLITLGELVRRYRDEIAPKHKGGGIEVIILNSFLEHDICSKTLAQLSTSDFASYRDTRLKEVKPATLKRQLTPIRSMLNTARDEWNIPLKENPLDKLKLNAPDNKRERRLQAGEDDRVFPVTKNALKMAWGRMMTSAGIEDLRLHDLRHEAVSRFFEMGLTVPEVASISGHRDMKS